MKIKTLRDILEPKANKLGISFEEVLEAIDDDKKFEYAILHFDKIKNNGNKGFYRKILNSFMSFDKFTEFCQNNFYVTPTDSMYEVYNKNICLSIIEKRFEELKHDWKAFPDDEYPAYFPKRWGEEDGDEKWDSTVKLYNNIEEIKEYTKMRIAGGFDDAIAGLWQQNCISMYIQFHAKNALWDKIDEFKIKDKIPTK